MLGGGMRQAGVLASACIYAIDNNINRLNDDHECARSFANQISLIPEVVVNSNEVETNMVYMKLPYGISDGLPEYMLKNDIIISAPRGDSDGCFRIVFHKDIDSKGTEKLSSLIFEYINRNKNKI